jgi:uncharacterized protein (DUF2235 family)
MSFHENITQQGRDMAASLSTPKRLVFCFDGTTNTLDTRYSTNVVKLAQSLSPMAKGVAQLIYYDRGVGTDPGEKIRGGALGHGLDKNLYDAYAFLIFNYTPGDEIYVFGFSRGAYTARSFVGLIYHCGVLRRRDAGQISEAIAFYRSRDELDGPMTDRGLEFRRQKSPLVCVSEEDEEYRCRNQPGYQAGDARRLHIDYLGVWDTVGALGLPAHWLLSRLDRRAYQFHDTQLTAFVKKARHAVAIDERRLTFSPTLWSNVAELNLKAGKDPASPSAPYQQQWFPGDHGSVGGGGDREGLSDQAFRWIVDGARAAGLHVDSDPSSRIYEIVPDHREHLQNLSKPRHPSLMQRLSNLIWGLAKTGDRAPGPQRLHEISVSARRRWLDHPADLKGGGPYRPAPLTGLADELNQLSAADYGVDRTVAELNDPKAYLFHKVRANDSLVKIARLYYGDPDRADDLLAANRDSLQTASEISAGGTVRVPLPVVTTERAPA